MVMKTIMYIHGYGSTGNATKAIKLRDMFPDARVVAPTFDYDRVPPYDIFRRLSDIVGSEQPAFIVGSSTGGYYALCCTAFYRGPVWCVNPVRDIMATIRRSFSGRVVDEGRLAEYECFDREVFRRLRPDDGQLRFALSTDDELLGDHRPLLELFPNHGQVIWMDHCGHRFFRFDELRESLAATLAG